MDEFRACEWNRYVSAMVSAGEVGTSSQGYLIGLVIFAAYARVEESLHPAEFKVNRMVRQKLGYWNSQFSQYQEFLDGCWLLMRYYDTENLLKKDYWTLVELHRRWSSLINASFYYGNKYQIANFVPFANKVVARLVAEMQRRKNPPTRKPQNWELCASQVKDEIDSDLVFRHYFPDMKPNGKQHKARCRWHTDSKNPNLVIYPDGHCHCYRCNANYDVFGMIMSLDNCDFATAVHRAYALGH